MHIKNINQIQKETIKILKETKKILPETIELEKIYKKTLDNEEIKLENLEYVIAVVGTVKAGKSTTINAIIGKEVLPHRTEAMTTLPTLITHVLGQEIPILKLPRIEPLIELIKKIKEQLSYENDSGFLKTDDGIEFRKQIDNNNFVFLDSYTGEKEIFNFLKNLNDMMRAAKELNLEPPFKEFENVNQLPRIEVEFDYLKQHDSISHSKLSLLDTPGPNEFKHSEHLVEIFQSQLKKASSIILVINYPQISSKGSGEIREEFARNVNFVGKNHMFVFANQLDNVSSNDSDPEKIKKNIAENKLDGQIDKSNVFPISAKEAFYSQLGINEIKRKGLISENLSWRIDFGETILGRKWKKEIDDVDEVKEACNDAWESSLFGIPLDIVIADAHSKASLNSLDGALNKLLQIANELNNTFIIQEGSLTDDIQKLQNDIVKLQGDIEKMKEISSNLVNTVDNRLKEIYEELNNLIRNELNNASDKIMSIFDEKDEVLSAQFLENTSAQHHGVIQSLGSTMGAAVSIIGKNVRDILDNEKQKKDEKQEVEKQVDKLRKSGELKFSSKEEALEFRDKIVKLTDEHTSELFNEVEIRFQEKSALLISDINDLIIHKLGDLLVQIKQSLGTDISIEIPSINFDKNAIVVRNSFKKLVKTETEEKQRRVQADYVGSSIASWFGDVCGTDWGYEWETYTVENNTITKQKLDSSLKNIFQLASDKIGNDANKIYNDFIKKSIDEMIEQLIKEIENYREEKLNIAKKREAGVIEIEDAITSAKYYQEVVGLLSNRIETAQKILNENKYE